MLLACLKRKLFTKERRGLLIVNWGRLKALLHRTTHNTTLHSNSKGGPPAAIIVRKPSIEGRIIGLTAVGVQ